MMAYRWHPRGADVDTEDPRAWATCDRCGRLYNLYKLTWQWDYRGGPQLENIRILVCDPCYDAPQPQNAAWILGPDPPPIFNARPEPYQVDSTNWLTTDDGSIITTDGGEEFITSNPNPATSPADAKLVTRILYPSGTLTSAYLDLFDGDPSAGGVSILFDITGSNVRSDIVPFLTTVGGIAENTAFYSVVSPSLATVNVSYAAIFDSATGGALLASAPVGSSPSITVGNGVGFDALALSIDLNT